MQWQMWTAFGIMLGYVADLAFYFVSRPTIPITMSSTLTNNAHRYPIAASPWDSTGD